MIKIRSDSGHATDDALELYALNLLKGKDRESIELHLLTCELCILSAEAVSEQISFMRQALRQYTDLETNDNGWRQIANISPSREMLHPKRE
jgi:hypothetical protein